MYLFISGRRLGDIHLRFSPLVWRKARERLWSCLFFCSFVCLFVVVALVGTLRLPWAHLGHPLGSLGHRLGALGHALGTLGHPSCYFNRPVGDIGHCRGDIWIPRGNPLAPFGHTLEATSAILETCLQKGQKKNFVVLPLGTLLGTGAYVIRPRLRSPNTH